MWTGILVIFVCVINFVSSFCPLLPEQRYVCIPFCLLNRYMFSELVPLFQFSLFIFTGCEIIIYSHNCSLIHPHSVVDFNFFFFFPSLEFYFHAYYVAYCQSCSYLDEWHPVYVIPVADVISSFALSLICLFSQCIFYWYLD